MAKPVKVWFTGVLPMANGSPLSRVQSLTMDPDLNFTELYELGNSSIIEYDRDTPSVTTTINTNDYASMTNLRKLTNILTGDITPSALDGKSVSITALVEQDSVLKRSICTVNAYLSSIAWNYDVGGLATENFTLSSSNKSIYTQAYRQLIVVPVSWQGSGIDNPKASVAASGYITSGTGILVSGSDDKYTWDDGTNDSYKMTSYTPLYVWNDTWKSSEITDALVQVDTTQDSLVIWSGTNTLDSGARIFCVAYRDTPLIDIEDSTHGYDTESGIAAVRKGQVLVEISPSGHAADIYEQWFRIQSVSVDVDLTRTAMDELGNYYPFYEAMPDPIVTSVNVTMLESDAEAFYQAAGLAWSEGDANKKEVDIDDFVKRAAIRISVYTNKDRLPGQLGKTILLDELQVTAESFSIDVSDNARQTLALTTSQLTVTGANLV